MRATNHTVHGTSPPAADLILPAHLQWGQKDCDPVHMVTLGTTVSSKLREPLRVVSPQKVFPSADSNFDLDLDDLLDEDESDSSAPPISSAKPSKKVSREVRGLQSTPKCW